MFLIYDKKNIGHEHLFFPNHLKSTKIKQSFFGKHSKLNTPKLNIHILTENCQNILIYGIRNIHNSSGLIVSFKYILCTKKTMTKTDGKLNPGMESGPKLWQGLNWLIELKPSPLDII